jgi:hypothetical protein
MPIDFNAKADDFIAQVRCANPDTSAKVALVFHLRDINGTLLAPFRESVVPSKLAFQWFASPNARNPSRSGSSIPSLPPSIPWYVPCHLRRG